MSVRPASKSKWGARKDRTGEEMNAICRSFFEKLEVPEGWKFIGWSNATDENTLVSVGKFFKDMRTSGMNLMHYRVFFHSWSERGGILETAIVDFGKYKSTCAVSNKNVEALNEWIREKYSKSKEQPPITTLNGEEQETAAEPDDGLQGIRDMIAGL